jgi:hypothetical protein
MDRFNVVTNTVRIGLVGLADLLCGCSHGRTTFPITPRGRSPVAGQPQSPSETYIACLECGRQLAYDWNTMSIAGRRPVWLTPQVLLGGTGKVSR